MGVTAGAAARMAAAAVIALTACVGGALAQGYSIGERLKPAPGKAAAPAPGAAREITWDDLVPADLKPSKLLNSLNLGTLDDADPRAIEAMAKLRAEWDRAPVVQSISGQRVKIAGFLVNLESSREGVGEFLLVPYFGACIHVPPPPLNQIIHAFAERPVPDKVAQGPVWITGAIEVVRGDTRLAAAGYRMRDVRVEPWVAPKGR